METYSYNNWDLSQLDSVLGETDLVSIKIRPVKMIGARVNQYVYPEEYAEILELIRQFPRKWSGGVNHGRAILFDFDGADIVFVEHETGPEIVFLLDLVRDAAIATGSAAVAGQQVVKFINMVCEIIRKHADAKNSGKKSSRYYGAGALSVEARVKETGKVLKQVKITSKAIGKVLKDISDIGTE